MPGWRPRKCTSTPSATPQKYEHYWFLKNGRTVKSIYSHNLFSSFATKKLYLYHKYAPSPPDTAWLQSIWGSVSKQANFVTKNIFLYPHFCQHKLCTYLLGNSLTLGRFHTMGWIFGKLQTSNGPCAPPLPLFQKTMWRFFQRNFSDWADPPPWQCLIKTKPNQTKPTWPTWITFLTSTTSGCKKGILLWGHKTFCDKSAYIQCS